MEKQNNKKPDDLDEIPSPKKLKTQSPLEEKKYQCRPIEIDDFNKGFLDLLNQLTNIGQVDQTMFQERFQSMLPNNIIIVIEDYNRIVATAKLFLEPKFQHNCCLVGHIEDVVVLKEYRGLHLGILLIEKLVNLAKEYNCYKVILNCKDTNIDFYKKCGLEQNETQMVKYLMKED